VGIDPQGPERHQLRRGAGCDACGRSGYRRRQGVFELLTVDDTVRQMIVDRTPATLIKQYGVRQGMSTLMMDGRQKALAGLTTVDEVIRVCAADGL
jgi:type II secretory ATPase GspE/PulE/Tfp pilus assembly ATPase PilB-like protein